MAVRTDERKAVSTEVNGLQKRVAALKEAVAQQRQAIILQCTETDDALRCEASHAVTTPCMVPLRLCWHAAVLGCKRSCCAFTGRQLHAQYPDSCILK